MLHYMLFYKKRCNVTVASHGESSRKAFLVNVEARRQQWQFHVKRNQKRRNHKLALTKIWCQHVMNLIQTTLI